MLKKLILLAFLVALSIGIERGHHKITDGFTLSHISAPLPLGENRGELPASCFNTPWRYLDCGAQSYVFESWDGSYVIKFFKFHHLRLSPLLQSLPLPSSLGRNREWKRVKREREKEGLLASLKIAAEKLQEQTGLVLLHLENSSSLPNRLVLVDKLGIRRTINPNNYPFLIQKKGLLLEEELKKSSNPRQALRSLVQLVIARCQKEVYDKDPNFLTNFAFVEGQAIELDTGRFSYNSLESRPEVYKEEVFRVTRPLRSWLEKTHPSLVSFFDQEVASCCAF